jgi:hypothetical protein
VGFNDRPADREPHAGALSLGAEERIKDLCGLAFAPPQNMPRSAAVPVPGPLRVGRFRSVMSVHVPNHFTIRRLWGSNNSPRGASFFTLPIKAVVMRPPAADIPAPYTKV